MPNPFIHSRLFFGRQDELRQLQRHIENGESALLIGGRRTGKTRLLEQLEVRTRAIFQTDAGAWQLTSETAAIAHLGQAMQAHCRDRQDLFESFASRAPLAMVIDEADRMLGQPWASDFLAWMRWLIGPRGLGLLIVFVLAGGPVLSGYQNPADNGSPPLNLSERLYLRPLHRSGCHDFAEVCPYPVDTAALMREAGGHPWLIERLLREIADGHDLDVALERAYEHCHETFPLWKRQLGPDGETFLRHFPTDGIAVRAFSRDAAWIPHRTAMIRARYLCLLREDEVEGERRYLPGPALFMDWLRGAPVEQRWDLAISYATEDVELARVIKQGLHSEFRIFFAPDEDAWLWGQHLYQVLPHVYGVDSRYVLVLSTNAYVRKHWTRVEFEAARALNHHLLVVNLGMLPEDMPPDVVYRGGALADMISLLDVLRERLSAA
jgi:hypothetical protein